MASTPQYEHMPRNALCSSLLLLLEPSTGGAGSLSLPALAGGSGNTIFIHDMSNARSCGWANIWFSGRPSDFMRSPCACSSNDREYTTISSR
ncbi:hypothetical protein OUZ56_024155 [Daphnia magna]|uniref:Secreted protein n=1 Tax=Daphnia magna TaxID=35525 RepID=A0ABR0B0A5_9CRUS|nr:hypothetical protein OUZ56_024155 [Daphnia magna]